MGESCSLYMPEVTNAYKSDRKTQKEEMASENGLVGRML